MTTNITNSYEAVVIFNAQLDDATVKDQVQKIKTLVESHQGKIEKESIWGNRQLAYEIKKQDHGIYVFFLFTGNNQLVSNLNRQLRINDSVLRHLVVKKDKFAPDSTKDFAAESMAFAAPKSVSSDRPGFEELEPEIDEDELKEASI